MSVLHAPVRSRPGNSPARLCAALVVLVVFGLPASSFGVAALRKSSPGFGSNCGPDPYTGNVMLSFADPVPTRGWPLVNNIHLNTQWVEPRRLGNATFTYDIHVTTGTFYSNGQGSTHLIVVDGTGRILDFGATPGQIIHEPGVFSTLTFANGVYTLSSAGPPESIDQTGNFQYLFNAAGQLSRITDPMGNTQSLAYSGGLLTTVTDNPTGKTITFLDGPGFTTIYQNQNRETTTVSYSLGKVVSIDWAQQQFPTALKRVDFTYGTIGIENAMLKTYTKDQDPASKITYSYTSLPPTGGPSQVMMANQSANETTTHEGTTNYVWGTTPAPGYADRVVSTNNAAPIGTTYYDFNGLGDIGQITLPTLAGAPAPTILTFGYNGARQVNFFSNSDSTHNYNLTYASNGMPQMLTDPIPHQWTLSWNGADLLSAVDPVGTLFTLGYGNPGLPHFADTVKDAVNNTWSFSPNLNGQVLQVTPPVTSTPDPVNFAYWEVAGGPFLGYPLSITDGNNNQIAAFDNYDPLGDLTSWRTFAAANGGSQSVFSLASDGLQRPTVFTQPDNRTEKFYYTGRNLDHTLDEANRQVNYSFCPVCGELEAVSCGAWGLNWHDNGDGNLDYFTNALNFQTVYSYGSAQELTKISYPDDAVGHNDNLQLLYDKYGRVRQVTDPRSNVFTLDYDNADNLTHVGGATTIWLSPLSDNSLYSATNDVGTTTIIPHGVTRQPARIVYNYTGAGLSNVQQLDYVYNTDGSRQSLTWHNGTALVGV